MGGGNKFVRFLFWDPKPWFSITFKSPPPPPPTPPPPPPHPPPPPTPKIKDALDQVPKPTQDLPLQTVLPTIILIILLSNMADLCVVLF